MAIEQDKREYTLLERIARGDEAALGALYDRYAGVIYGFVLKLVGAPEEAEEVVLDVFSQAWRSASAYDPRRARVDAWLFMMARSRATDRLRARVRLARTDEAHASAVREAGPLADPEEDALIAERRREVLSALGALPPPQRTALELVYFEGLTHHEVSVRTGEPLGTVKTRVRLGLGKLRESLTGQWG